MKPPPRRAKAKKIVDIDLQQAIDVDQAQACHVPNADTFHTWISACIAAENLPRAVVTVRLVDLPEITDLNQTYRHKTGPTNVLSFPCDLPQEISQDFLGDIIICAPVVAREAAEQNKNPAAHWCHMVVHGILHLLGYDHEDDAQAQTMEQKEREILAGLGFDDPYRDESLSQVAIS